MTEIILRRNQWLAIPNEVSLACPRCQKKSWYDGEVFPNGSLRHEIECPHCEFRCCLRLEGWQPREPPPRFPFLCGLWSKEGGDSRERNPCTEGTEEWLLWERGFEAGKPPVTQDVV